MPIIPRYQQEFDPNQPPRLDFGDRLIQGLMAGSQMQRQQAEAEFRREGAARYKREGEKLDELERASAAADMFIAERKFGGVGARPEQFMPDQEQGGAAQDRSMSMPDTQVPLSPDFQSPMSITSDNTPTRSPSPINVKARQSMADLDAADKADFEAARAYAQQQGFGPVGTTAMLRAVQASSLERRQKFDVEQVQSNFQNAIVGYERIGQEDPGLRAALERNIESMKLKLDRLDDQMTPDQRDMLIRDLDASIGAANEIVRGKRNQIVQRERSIATARQYRDKYEPENPNAKMWTDVETVLSMNPEMDSKQMDELISSAIFKEKGYKQDPFTGGWLTDEQFSRTMDDRAKRRSDIIESRKGDRQRQMEKWYESRPDYNDITREADAAYSAQFQSVEEVDPASGQTIKKTVPVVKNAMSRQDVYDLVEDRMQQRWESMRPRRAGAGGRGRGGDAGPDVESIVGESPESDFEGAGPVSTGPESTVPPSGSGQLPAGVGPRVLPGQAMPSAISEFEIAAQQRPGASGSAEPYKPGQSPSEVHAYRAPRYEDKPSEVSPWEQESRRPVIRYGEDVAVSVPTDATNFVRRMLGMNPLGYDFYGEVTNKEVEARRQELEKEADRAIIEAKRSAYGKDAEARKAAAEEAKAKVDRFDAMQQEAKAAREASGAEWTKAAEAYRSGLQSKSAAADKAAVRERQSKDVAKARSGLAQMLGVQADSLSKGAALSNRVKNLLVATKFDDGVIETVLATGLYSQKDIDAARAEYDRGAETYRKAKER